MFNIVSITFLSLDQGSANFYSKGSDNKYPQLCEPYSLCHDYSTCHCDVKAAIDNLITNEHSCVPIKLLQKQAGAQTWPTGCSLPTPSLDNQQNN